MSNGTTPSKKDGSLKKANWVDSALKQGVEGHDYFIRGTKYTNSNVSAKYGGVMNMSGVTPAFKPFSYDEEKPIKTGSASSLDRMQAMVDNLNQSSSTVVNNPNISQFKEETKYETPDDENLREAAIKANQNIEGQEMKQRSRDRSDAQYAKSITGAFLKDKHGNRITKKDNDEYMAAQDFQGRMNIEKGLFQDGRRVNHLGQTPGAVDAENKRKATANNPALYNVADDLTRSGTGWLAEQGQKPGWYGNPAGLYGKSLNLIGVDEKGISIAEAGKQALWHAPGTGEMIDAYHLAKDAYKGFKTGDYSDAKLSLGALAVPFASAGDVKKGYKATKQLFKGASNLTNITGNVNKFSKTTGNFASQMNKNNPFKIGENLSLNLANKAGFSKSVKAFKSSKDQYKRNILQRESIEESKNEPIAKKITNSGLVKSRS